MAAVTHGVRGFTLADYYESAAGAHDGSPAGHWVAVAMLLENQINSASRDPFYIGTAAGSPRVYLRISGANATANFYWYNGSSWPTTPVISFLNTDIGKRMLLVSVLDAPAAKIRSYHRRIEQASGSGPTTWTPGTGNVLRVGSSGVPAPDQTVMSVAHGFGVPSFAHIQALYDAFIAEEDIPPAGIPGYTAVRFSFRDAVHQHGGQLPDSVPDSFGRAAPLVKIGSPKLAPFYTRSFNW